MHKPFLLASFLLFAGLLPGQALANTSSVDATPALALEARDAWYSEQVLVRSVMRVDVTPKGKAAADTFWMFIERTPSGYSRVVIKDNVSSPDRMTFLIQDKTNLVVAGEYVDGPPAGWMLGQYLFGQPLEPTMLLRWAMGLPGNDFRLGEPPAEIDLDGPDMKSISQAGWKVNYNLWRAPGHDRPALPWQMKLVGDRVNVAISLVEIDTHAVVPKDYSEFSIR